MAEWTLGEARQESLAVVDSVADYAIFLLDREGRVRTWNDGARLIKQYEPEEIIGSHISRFYTDEDRVVGRAQHLLGIAATEGRVEDEGWRVRMDGTRFWADVVITAIRDPDGTVLGFLKVTRDLTERRAAELALRRSEQSLASTLYSIGDGVISTDEHGRIARLNRVAEQLTGWTEAEAIGVPFETVFQLVDEPTGEPASSPVRKVLERGEIIGLANHVSLIARDGTQRPIADSGAPIRDAAGAMIGAVVVFRDLSHERQTEVERVRAIRAEEAVRERDVFLAVAAHELRTPLTALRLKLDSISALLDKGDRDKVATRFEDARRQTSRIVDLVERLLDLSRIAAVRMVLEREMLDLGELLAQITSVLPTVTLDATGDLRGSWDRQRLEQVFTNLTTNAVKYGQGQPVEVSAIAESEAVTVRVVDHGIGIAPQDLGRVFAPFERATPVEHFTGLGLGLYVTKGIIETHGGTIAVKSEVGSGSTFEVRLPRSVS